MVNKMLPNGRHMQLRSIGGDLKSHLLVGTDHSAEEDSRYVTTVQSTQDMLNSRNVQAAQMLSVIYVRDSATS